MNNIIENTFKFIDELDKSDIMINIKKYKELLLKDKNILSKIELSKNITDSNELINIRKYLYSNNNYKKYMEYYNELNLLIIGINKQYKKYMGERQCI